MNPILSGTALGWTRSPRYWSKDFLYPCPCTPVFRAKVAAVPSGVESYLSIDYNTVSLGAYTDIQIGQTVIISATTDHTDYLYIGRVADAATSSLIPVNESAYPLSMSYFVTIIDEYREPQRVRAGELVDGRTPYQNVPPAIKNMRSAYHKWSATTASLSFAPVGQAMADGGGSLTYHWVFPDTVTFNDGDENTREIEIEAPHGHLWGRLEVTDTISDTMQWMVFQIFVDDPSSPTLALTAADRLSLTRTISGHHCTFTAYKNVRTDQLIDGTRMIVVSKPRYSNGDPNLDPVAFVGYLTKETNSTNGPNDKSVSFEMAGLWEKAGQLPFNAIAIRDTASPSVWDEMVKPTIQRTVWHILTRYSVLPNLVAIDFDVTDNTWYGGDRNVSSNSLGDACEQALSEINAVLIGDPSGQMYLRRWAFFLTAAQKNALDTVATLGSSDLRNLNFARTHDDPVGRVVIGFAGFYTDGSDPKIGRARAPSVTLGTSPEVREINNQLMRADQSETDLLTEASERAANQLGVANSPYILGGDVRDGFAWMTPSVSQWVPVTLATAITTRGRTMSNVRHLLTSVQIDYDNRANTHSNKFELTPEPGPQSALVVTNLTPGAQALDEIITPPKGAYPGLNSPSSLNSPDTTTKRRFNRSNMGGIGSTIPADTQADAAARTPDNGSRVVPIGFWVPDAVNAGFLTVLDAPYTVTAKGSAQLSSNTWTQMFDMTSGLNGWTLSLGSFSAGVGVLAGNTIVAAPAGIHSFQVYITHSAATVTAVTFMFDLTKGTFSVTSPVAVIYLGGGIVQSVNPADITNGPDKTLTWTGVQAGITGITVQAVSSYDNSLPYAYDGSTTLTQIVVSGTGTNPFTGDPGTPLYGDGLFVWELDADGNEVNVRLNPDGGLMIDGTVAATMLYSKSHEYTFKRTGTGNQFALVFADSDHTDNQRVPLLVTIEGPNAGT